MTSRQGTTTWNLKALKACLLELIKLFVAHQVCLSSKQRSKEDLHSTANLWLVMNAGGASTSVLEAAAHDVL